MRVNRGLPRRVRCAVLLAVTAAIALAGCSSGPSERGAAVIIGDQRVTTESIRQQLDETLSREGPQVKADLVRGRELDDVARQIVTDRVQQMLLAEATRREGLSVTESEIAEILEQAGGAEAGSQGTIFNAEQFPGRVRDQLLALQLGQQALSELTVTIDFTTADTRTAAQERVEELAAAGAEGSARMIQSDMDQGLAAGLDQEVSAAQNPTLVEFPLFSVEPGTVVAFQENDTQPWLIAIVRDRTVDEDADDASVSDIDPQVVARIGVQQLASIARELGVRLNPRYGQWDPTTLRAIPATDEPAGFVEPLRGGADRG